MARVLVVDDDLAIREMVAMALSKAGFETLRAGSVAEARRRLAEKPQLVVSDIYMPGEDGLALLAEIREMADPPAVILMTARGSVETAALAARTGAFDYLAKPFDVAVLVERASAAVAARKPAEAAAVPEGPESLIVGSHPSIVTVYKAVARVAPLRVPVLVLGETGTGKELVAKALHRFGSRPQGPLVAVHCGAIPDTLIEAELFGYRRGAFTDAHRDHRGAIPQADGGTLFLDEVGEISSAFQVKLLRFLEDGLVTPLGADRAEPVDARVVAATHRDLGALVAEGRFRQDLFYRLAGYEIRIPPLRDRLTDLPELVRFFARRAAPDVGLEAVGEASPEVLARLAGYAWPGNVRELAHVVRRLLIDTGGLQDEAAANNLTAGDGQDRPAPEAAPPEMALPPGRAPLPLDEAERCYLAAVLAWAGGNKSEAARVLGIERKTLARKLSRDLEEET